MPNLAVLCNMLCELALLCSVVFELAVLCNILCDLSVLYNVVSELAVLCKMHIGYDLLFFSLTCLITYVLVVLLIWYVR